MKGFIVIFNNKNREAITKINHSLFGRICYTPKGKYYYSGLLENTKYSRLSNGCYFIESINNNLNGLINIIKVDIEIDSNILCTAKDYWKKHIEKNGLIVKNL